MLGKKVHTNPGILAARMQKITEAPCYQPKPAATSDARAPRKPAYRPGTLTFIGGEKVDVMVTNLSATGARVQHKRGTPLPERVCLKEGHTGKEMWAYVTWQAWGVAGLQFVGAKAVVTGG